MTIGNNLRKKSMDKEEKNNLYIINNNKVDNEIGEIKKKLSEENMIITLQIIFQQYYIVMEKNIGLN